MRRLVTISYTGLDAGGGVPKFNRDLHETFTDRECVHFCWKDVPGHDRIDIDRAPEWTKALVLNQFLVYRRHVSADDDIVADGFWADGLDHLPFVISHSHGIWGHVTKADVDAGKRPENPQLHEAQVNFRKRWLAKGKPLTAVSTFIADQMFQQWGFTCIAIINNGVDTVRWTPARKKFLRDRPIIVHGINDRSNHNKGWEHIEALRYLPAEILSLDEMVERYGGPKEWALAQADLVVHPSGYEGSSMFVAETLASGVPLVAYDVGGLYGHQWCLETIMPIAERSPERTLGEVQRVLGLSQERLKFLGEDARMLGQTTCDIKYFRENWRRLIDGWAA